MFKVWELKNGPRPPGCAIVKGTPFWRLRQGDWRILYRVIDEQRRVVVVRVLRRNERTYEGLH